MIKILSVANPNNKFKAKDCLNLNTKWAEWKSGLWTLQVLIMNTTQAWLNRTLLTWLRALPNHNLSRKQPNVDKKLNLLVSTLFWTNWIQNKMSIQLWWFQIWLSWEKVNLKRSKRGSKMCSQKNYKSRGLSRNSPINSKKIR